MPSPLPGVPLSVPDVYSIRSGVSHGVLPERGVSVSVGARIDGIPVRDVVGGNDGFRRPGYSIYLDPGLAVVRGRGTVALTSRCVCIRTSSGAWPISSKARPEAGIWQDTSCSSVTASVIELLLLTEGDAMLFSYRHTHRNRGPHMSSQEEDGGHSLLVVLPRDYGGSPL